MGWRGKRCMLWPFWSCYFIMGVVKSIFHVTLSLRFPADKSLYCISSTFMRWLSSMFIRKKFFLSFQSFSCFSDTRRLVSTFYGHWPDRGFISRFWSKDEWWHFVLHLSTFESSTICHLTKTLSCQRRRRSHFFFIQTILSPIWYIERKNVHYLWSHYIS